ncbi:MAG: hypothetical protein JST59_25695 [Actinobacteria bacterium]|nr:hypothetical protein [Actinomycetota bacterium]
MGRAEQHHRLTLAGSNQTAAEATERDPAGSGMADAQRAKVAPGRPLRARRSTPRRRGLSDPDQLGAAEAAEGGGAERGHHEEPSEVEGNRAGESVPLIGRPGFGWVAEVGGEADRGRRQLA